MSTESTPEESIREDITNFLRRNFPQIKMHGGTFTIETVDLEANTIEITLSGACDGCGISPMTIQALKTRLTDEITEIDTVHARTSQDQLNTTQPTQSTSDNDTDDITPEAPF